MTERQHPCGSVAKLPISAVADRAGRWIMEYESPRAVTIDPQGRVFVERPAEAAEADLVGCYTRSLGLLELSRRLIEDLRWESEQRGFSRRLARAA